MLASVVLAVVGVSSSDAALIRGSYLSLESIGWYVLVPLSVASLATGLIQSLGTSWGLARHYWVLVKLLLNVFATGVLLLYVPTGVASRRRLGRPAMPPRWATPLPYCTRSVRWCCCSRR